MVVFQKRCATRFLDIKADKFEDPLRTNTQINDLQEMAKFRRSTGIFDMV